jgi:hypothetical protein
MTPVHERSKKLGEQNLSSLNACRASMQRREQWAKEQREMEERNQQRAREQQREQSAMRERWAAEERQRATASQQQHLAQQQQRLQRLQEQQRRVETHARQHQQIQNLYQNMMQQQQQARDREEAQSRARELREEIAALRLEMEQARPSTPATPAPSTPATPAPSTPATPAPRASEVVALSPQQLAERVRHTPVFSSLEELPDWSDMPSPSAVMSAIEEDFRWRMDRAKERYETLSGATVDVGEVEVNVKEFTTGLLRFRTAYRSRMGPDGVPVHPFTRGRVAVRFNPVMVIAEPFLHPENGRNIYAARDWAVTQRDHGSGNVNAPRAMQEIEAVEAEFRPQPPGK